MLTIWLGLRALRRTKQLPRFTLETVENVDRMARAYGYEIGAGAGLTEQVVALSDNPFLKADWREGIAKRYG